MTDDNSIEKELLDKIWKNREEIKTHTGIAEQGKIYALAGDHKKALFYYKRAMDMTVRAGEPEIFFRHYLECVMESLELMGSYDEVLEYCNKAIRFYKEKPPPNPAANLDLANIHQRRGVILLKIGDNNKEEACSDFKKATALALKTNHSMPLSENLSKWIGSGMYIDNSRLLNEQKRTKYFSIRQDVIRSEIAIKLPDENMQPF